MYCELAKLQMNYFYVPCKLTFEIYTNTQKIAKCSLSMLVWYVNHLNESEFESLMYCFFWIFKTLVYEMKCVANNFLIVQNGNGHIKEEFKTIFL